LHFLFKHVKLNVKRDIISKKVGKTHFFVKGKLLG